MKLDFDRIREKLSEVDAVALLTMLGVLAGLVSGLVILAFRFVIEATLNLILPDNSENFEGLSMMMQGALPLTGAVLLGALFTYLKPEHRRVGVGRVIERFNLYQGNLSLRGLVVQFVGAAVTLVSGLSMGREGPAVQLGAASSSLLAQWARLPNNSVRILTSCGCAAAISASFNTPISGVIFAMEVIMMEYSISSFIPIILASVVGAALTRAVYGHEPAFIIPEVQLGSLIELPFIVVFGIAVGFMAAALIYLSKYSYERTAQLDVGLRFFIAGTVTAILGLIAPEILGIGYDSVNTALIGGFTVTSLFLIMTLKLIATSACVGLGLPGGVIGPSLVIGAMAGGVFGSLGVAILPNDSNVTLYVLLGMAGMMAATLAAPLAALMALLELTFEANIIFPGMLVVVISCLVANHLFKQKGIFQTMLDAQGVKLRLSPLASHLHRAGVATVMKRKFGRVNHAISLAQAKETMSGQPNWLLLEKDGIPTHYMPAADLALHLEALEKEQPEPSKETDEPVDHKEQDINLFEIPANRENVTPVLLSATLQEALDTMEQQGVNAVYVRRMSAPNIYRVFGFVRKQDIEHFYHR